MRIPHLNAPWRWGRSPQGPCPPGTGEGESSSLSSWRHCRQPWPGRQWISSPSASPDGQHLMATQIGCYVDLISSCTVEPRGTVLDPQWISEKSGIISTSNCTTADFQHSPDKLVFNGLTDLFCLILVTWIWKSVWFWCWSIIALSYLPLALLCPWGWTPYLFPAPHHHPGTFQSSAVYCDSH